MEGGYPTNISDYRIGYALYVLSEYELVRESMIHEYAEKGKCDVSLQNTVYVLCISESDKIWNNS